MFDCGKSFELGTDVFKAPSEVGEGPPSEVMVCAPSEEMRGVLHGPGEFSEKGEVVVGWHVAGSVPLAGKS